MIRHVTFGYLISWWALVSLNTNLTELIENACISKRTTWVSLRRTLYQKIDITAADTIRFDISISSQYIDVDVASLLLNLLTLHTDLQDLRGAVFAFAPKLWQQYRKFNCLDTKISQTLLVSAVRECYRYRLYMPFDHHNYSICLLLIYPCSMHQV